MEATEPMLPMEATEPTLPRDRTEPRHPMESKESLDHSDKREESVEAMPDCSTPPHPFERRSDE